MTRIKTTAFISDIRGSIAGSTFQNSLSGLTLKAKAFPKRSLSAQAQKAKSVITYLSQQWLSLTENQRNQWEVQAGFAPVAQRNNPERFINGQQLYMKYNAALYNQFSIAQNSVSPSTSSLPVITLTVTRSGAAILIDVSQAIDEANYFLAFRISAPQRSSQSNSKGGSKLIVLTFGNTTQVDIQTQYLALFGTRPLTGQFLTVEYQLISATSVNFSVRNKIKLQVL